MTAIWFICISLAMFITSAWVILYRLAYMPGYAGFAVTIFTVIHSLLTALIVLRIIREHNQSVDLRLVSVQIRLIEDKLVEIQKEIRQ
jgi:hypothetical protein